MTIARQFTVLIAIPLLLVTALAVALTYQFASLSREETRLIANLQRTAILNQELAKETYEQADRLQQQFTQLDASFIERSRMLDYSLGEKYTDYLRLNIGDQERLTIEAVKSLQSEVSILSMQVYEQLRSTDRAGAYASMPRVRHVQEQVRNAFETLNDLQLDKLGGVVEQLNHSARRWLVVVIVCVALFVAALGTVTVTLRRRILRSVNAILATSERIRGGNLAARAPEGQTDEFGELTRGFNFMAESLAESHRGLERRVDERTRQLRETQDQLIRAEKMSAVGVLVSGVAHELNNPLAAIRGLVELALRDLQARGGGPASAKMLEEVDAQVERCRRIVLNLLQFARKQEPRLDTVDLNAAVDQVLQLRDYEWKTSQTTLVREFDPARPVLSADRDQIQQVLLNLVNNAHDAIVETGQPGTIWVRTQVEPPNVAIEVRDTGPGFSDVGRAFDPFYTTKEEGKGTGLGLSVSYGIVHDHHGQIQVGNWERGARVIVTLPIGDVAALPPAASAAPPTLTASHPAASTAGSLQALVVDDESLLVRLQIAFLATMGITGAGVSSGQDAISYLQDHHVDVIISDVRMPGAVDGPQLYQWVLEHQPDAAKAFIFVSGDVASLTLGEFFQNSGVPRIQKPFQLSEYSNVIHQVLKAGGRLP